MRQMTKTIAAKISRPVAIALCLRRSWRRWASDSGEGPGTGRLALAGAGVSMLRWLTPPVSQLWCVGGPLAPARARHNPRSEEHTSELQSRFDFVCSLLLAKNN